MNTGGRVGGVDACLWQTDGVEQHGMDGVVYARELCLYPQG